MNLVLLAHAGIQAGSDADWVRWKQMQHSTVLTTAALPLGRQKEMFCLHMQDTQAGSAIDRGG